MRRGRKYTPYVRLANGRERSESLREALRLAFFEQLGQPFFVMVQRGWPNDVIGVGATKREVQQSPLTVALKRDTFRTWAAKIQKRAAGNRRAKAE